MQEGMYTKEEVKRMLTEHRYLQRYSRWYVDSETRRTMCLDKLARSIGYSILKPSDNYEEYRTALRIWNNRSTMQRNIGNIFKDLKEHGYIINEGQVFRVEGATTASVLLEKEAQQNGYSVKAVRPGEYVTMTAEEKKQRDLDELWTLCKAATDEVLHYNLRMVPWTKKDEALYQYYKRKYAW